MPTSPTVHPLARLPEEWAERLAGRGERAFRAQQVFRWIHRRGIFEPAQMTDLTADLRAWLEQEGVGAPLEVVEARRSSDATRKLLLRLRDGATIESVLIPSRHVDGAWVAPDAAARSMVAEIDADAAAAVEDEIDEEDDHDRPAREGSAGTAPGRSGAEIRVTQCISTQVGCAMGCVFCASGVAGLKRHLGAEEIAAQVVAGAKLLEPGERLRNIVLMGMGEPLHNYEATARALRLLTHPMGVNLSPRRITVSTSGLVPEIGRLGAEFHGQIGLAISLHAADDETRSRLMPINRKYPLAELMAALRAYPLPKRRRITIEYTLVASKNDTAAEAQKLARLLRGLAVKINLIPMNPIAASSLGPPDLGRVEAFQQVLVSAGYSCFVRRRRGDDVAAACGQLALLGAKPKVRVLRD